MKGYLPDNLRLKYDSLKESIKARLEEFKKVPQDDYFYEFCFCILTPQSKAINANKVIESLKKKNFREEPFNPVNILSRPANYIRFHNSKAKRLLAACQYFPEVIKMLESKMKPSEKRQWLVDNINGFGMKESSHFLRNIGYTGLAILDRHIIKHLIQCHVLETIPKISTIKKYLEIEKNFLEFSSKIKIPVDELDLLFWSYETGEILK